MSETGWAAFIGENHAEESAVERSARLAKQAAERQDRADQAAETERAAAIEDERDRRLMTYQQLGIAGRSAGQVFAEAGRIGDEDAEYEAARSVMERIERRRAQRARAREYDAQLLTTAEAAQRSADPLAAAQREAHRAFAEATRAKMSAAASGVPAPRARRPFGSVSRGAGQAVRSEQCVHCITSGVSDEEAYLLHSDPEFNVPVTAPERAEQAESRSEHGGRVPMIYR